MGCMKVMLGNTKGLSVNKTGSLVSMRDSSVSSSMMVKLANTRYLLASLKAQLLQRMKSVSKRAMLDCTTGSSVSMRGWLESTLAKLESNLDSLENTTDWLVSMMDWLASTKAKLVNKTD